MTLAEDAGASAVFGGGAAGVDVAGVEVAEGAAMEPSGSALGFAIDETAGVDSTWSLCAIEAAIGGAAQAAASEEPMAIHLGSRREPALLVVSWSTISGE